tara:strand:+ start:163 stop:588 length:426 start_codon:yes stop_codon:yes gene_type:complete
MPTLTLMHGTCICAKSRIMQSGLNANSYLTNNLDVACYYAQCAADECDSGCSEGDIVSVRVDTRELRADYPSFEEPLSYFRNTFTTCDKQWFEMLEKGIIPYPACKTDYKTSLRVVHSVLHVAPIHASNVMHNTDNEDSYG